jgi:hypothetical membrane protein
MGQKRQLPRATLLIRICAAIGVLACLEDIYVSYLLGSRYPGYNPMLQAMSDLGHEGSPVARIASTGWVIMGLMFIIFGYGFYRAFFNHSKIARTAGWMLALYGIGEGLGSGLIPGTPGHYFEANASIFHSLLGGVGVSAAVLLPFVIIKMFNATKSPFLFWHSWLTTVFGVFFLILFSLSNFYRPEGNWISYLGLWQRIYVLIYYLYFICLAVLMLVDKRSNLAGPNA